MKKIIFIDPGHGGTDPGAQGKEKTKESMVNLRISKRIRKLLRPTFNVKMSRTKDVHVELDERWKKANRVKADTCISIHQNASTDRSVKGSEVFIRPSASAKDKKLATLIQNRLVKAGRIPGRGVAERNLSMTVYPTMPACLVECDFLSNPYVEKKMQTTKWIRKTAKAIAKGIADYFGVDLKAKPKKKKVTYPTIKQGSKGKAVRVLQKALKINVDGIFGPKTDKAVRKFQSKNSLKVDGIVGEKTWKAVMQ